MKKSILLLLLFILWLHAISGYCQTASSLPFILQDEQKLLAFKQQYENRNAYTVKTIDSLVEEAGKIVKAGQTYSVTFQKSALPPSGDKHDYVSQAPYWWPDSSKPGGKPYIRRDGLINPERNQSKDYGQLGRMHSEVKQLALAYYFTGNETYAKQAVSLVKIWFIDTATRMNPNLNYGQYVPGLNDGRGIGIIETAGLTNIPDALAMLRQSKHVSNAFITETKKWFEQYSDWLMNSKNGKDESIQLNNHGTYYDMQLADFAFFTNNRPLTKKVLVEQSIPRMDGQFTTDGAQPLELARTKSWSYANMNALGWCRLATIADRVHVDLWHTQTKDGKGIQKMLAWFQPFMLKEKEWQHQQIEPVSYSNMIILYQLAADKYPGNIFTKTLALYPEASEQKPWW